MTPLYDENRMPLDARALAGFLPLANELYERAGLSGLWGVLEPSYDAALGDLASPIREVLVGTEAYLRLSGDRAAGRRAVILLELSLPVNSVNLRNYPDNLYIVLGDSESVPVGVARHGYLHLLLDPLIAVHRDDELAGAAGLLAQVDGVQGVRAEYTADFETMAAESLIRAIELRMDAPAEPGRALDRAYREGLLLAPFFEEGLARFEDGELGIREFLPVLMDSLDAAVEQERFADRFDRIPVPETVVVRGEVPPNRPPDLARTLLEQAEAAFNSGDNETARILFTRVLGEIDPENGPAFYGLALVASRDQDPARAREYFARTLASPTSERSMLLWSHVYLGRIEDIACDREEALSHYESTLEIGAGEGGEAALALDAARRGLESAFGGNC